MTHICVSNLTIIGSDNGLSPGRRQAIFWTNAGILLIRSLGTNFSEILIGIQTFLFTKTHLKMSSAKWCPFCLGLNVLTKSTSKLGHGSLIASHRFTCMKPLIHTLISSLAWQISVSTLRRRQIAAVFQTTFSNRFRWMKMYEFRLKFHWSLFLRVQLTIFHDWFR